MGYTIFDDAHRERLFLSPTSGQNPRRTTVIALQIAPTAFVGIVAINRVSTHEIPQKYSELYVKHLMDLTGCS